MSFSLEGVSRCTADILGLTMLRSGGTLFDKWELTVGSHLAHWNPSFTNTYRHVLDLVFRDLLHDKALTPGSRGRTRNTGNKVGRQAPQPRILLLVEFFPQVAIGQGLGGLDIRERWPEV
jgi:hypothetical protein